jgi:hypothetical protein
MPSVIHHSLANEGETKRKDEKTIYNKLLNHEYSTHSQIEQDLTTTTQEILKSLPANSEPYNSITRFHTLIQDIILTHNVPSTPSPKQAQHALRSSSTPLTAVPSPAIPASKPPLRETLYTMGPNGPLFTSLSLPKSTLPSALTLPTATGGTFTASTAQIVPTHPPASPKRGLSESLRTRQTFERRRAGFAEDTARVGGTKWLEWGYYSSFAPMWDDGGVSGGFGAEWMVVDWAYKQSRKQKKTVSQEMEVAMEPIEEDLIDEKLLLEWEPPKPSEDLVVSEQEGEDDEREMSVDDTLDGLRRMIILLGQMQTLRLAGGKSEIPDDEMALGIFSPNILMAAENIVTTFQDLIVTHDIPPKSLMSSLPAESYNIIHLSHPEFTGTLPSRNFPLWTPPQQQRHYPPLNNRPLQVRDMNPSQRYSMTPVNNYRPVSSSAPQRQYTTPVTPSYNSPGAYNTPPSVPLGHRPVGRPRKYEIRTVR